MTGYETAYGRRAAVLKGDREDARFKLRHQDGSVAYPIDNCSDVEDAWNLRAHAKDIPQERVEAHVRHAARELGCDGPWNEGGKSLEALAVAGLPKLEGDEAVHNDALRRAMAAVAELYQQEQAENEPDCMAQLQAIADALVAYAQQEAGEYDGDGGSDDDMPDDGKAYRLKADPVGIVHKAFATEIKSVDEGEGIVTAIVNTRQLDLQDDVMVEGCWGDVLKAARAGKVAWPAVCWNHDWADVRGKVLSAQETPAGLEVVVKYAMTTASGRDAFELVRGNYVTQWSVGFEPDAEFTRHEKGVRFIGRVKRWPELSNVILGASIGTQTTSAKAATAEESVNWVAVLEALAAETEPEFVPSFVAAAGRDPEASARGYAVQAEGVEAKNRHTSFPVWERERDPRSTTSGGSYCGVCQVGGHRTEDCSKVRFSTVQIPRPPVAWPHYQDGGAERFRDWAGIDG